MTAFQPPENILYVCAATGYGPANLVPIYALGRRRIKHLVILRAVADPDNPNETERREAIATAERLQLFGFDELRLDHDHITVLDGDPDSILGWAPAAQRIAAISAEGNLHLIINLTGGPKQLALGLEHHLRSTAKPYTRLFYSKYPAAPLFLFPSGNELVEGSIEQPEERAPLELLVEAARMAVCRDDAGTQEFKERMSAQPDDVRAILPRLVFPQRGQLHLRPGVVAVVGQMNRAALEHHLGALAVGRGEGWRQVRDLLDPNGVLGISNAGLAETDGAVRFVKGGWFEALVWHELRAALQRFGDNADVRLSVSLRSARAVEETDEVDILVRLGDQLHLVEAKTWTTTAGEDGERLGSAIKKLAGLRRTLGGTACRAWLVAPFLSFSAVAQEEWNNRAGDAGVTLLVGPGALQDLVLDVTQMAQ